MWMWVGRTAYNWIGWEQSPSRSLKIRTFKASRVVNIGKIHVSLNLSKPRWWKVARESCRALVKSGKSCRAVVKSCIWEIPRALSRRKPIKVEHMKSYSNLTMPNSCPNDEWRERFQTRVGWFGRLPQVALRQIWIHFHLIWRLTVTTHSKTADIYDGNNNWRDYRLKFLSKLFLTSGCHAKWTGWRGSSCCGRRTPTSSQWASRSLTRWE